MRKRSNRGPSPAKQLLTLARTIAGLGIDLRAVLASVEPRHRDRANAVTQLVRRLASEIEEFGIDSELGKVGYQLPDAGPELPIIAAIEARSREPLPDFEPGIWGTVPIPKIPGITSELSRLCRDSGLKDAGQAWDQLERGTLSPHYWTHREAKALESLIAALRAHAGDPAEFTAPVDLPHLDAPGGPDWSKGADYYLVKSSAKKPLYCLKARSADQVGDYCAANHPGDWRGSYEPLTVEQWRSLPAYVLTKDIVGADGPIGSAGPPPTEARKRRARKIAATTQGRA